MKNFIKKLKYSALALLLLGSSVSAAGTPISIPSAPGAGYWWPSTTTGAAIASSTNNFYIGNLYASSTTATSTFMHGLILDQTKFNVVQFKVGLNPTYQSGLQFDENGTDSMGLLYDGSGSTDLNKLTIFDRANNIERFTFQRGGVLGISSTTPSARLTVNSVAGDLFSFWVGSTTAPWMRISNSGFGTTTVSGLTISGSATSTSNVGFNISTGCYAINNTCISGGGVGTVTSVVAGVGFLNRGLNIQSSGTLNVGISTSSNPTLGQVTYWTGVGDASNGATVGSVATTSFAAANSTLTVTGTLGALVGGSNSTIALNLGNANSWTALQTFGNSSTTLASFSYASSTVWRGGGLTTDCDNGTTSKLLWDLTTGQFSCGTDQGGGGGTPAGTGTEWQYRNGGSFGAISNSAYNSALNTAGLGTTTPQWLLQLSSSTAPQLALGDGTNNQWTFRNAGGNLYLSTSSPTTFATSSQWSALAVYPGLYGANFAINSTGAPLATFDVYEQNGTGCSPGIRLGGNVGGDSNTFLCRQSDNDSSNDDFFSIGGNSSTNQQLTLNLAQGYLGVSSTTPWGLFSIASSTWNDPLRPLFAVSTSTGPSGELVKVFATSSVYTKSDPNRNENGARVVIGNSPFTSAPLLDQLEVEGRINQKYIYTDCDIFNSFQTQLTGDTERVCGNYGFNEDTAAVLDPGMTSTAISYARIRTGTAGTIAAANDGASITLQRSGASFLVAASSTPITEITARIGLPQNASSTIYYIGFSEDAGAGGSLSSAPNDACVLTASSTAMTGNWWLWNKNSAGTGTFVDTGVASSTNITAVGDFYKFRIEVQTNRCTSYITNLRTGTVTKTQITGISNSFPNNVGVLAGVTGTAAGLTKELHVRSFRLWLSGYDEPQ